MYQLCSLKERSATTSREKGRQGRDAQVGGLKREEEGVGGLKRGVKGRGDFRVLVKRELSPTPSLPRCRLLIFIKRYGRPFLNG